MKRTLFSTSTLALVFTTVLSFSALSLWAQQPQPRAEQVPAGAGAMPAAGQGAKSNVPGLTTDKQKASYGIGLSIGGNMRGSELTANDLDMQALMRGLSDALSEAKPALTKEELQQCMTEFHSQITGRVQDKVKNLADKDKKEGDAFLAANKGKPGVKALPSGLQYKVLQSGNGASPGPTDMVKAHYKGTLLDGTVFDSSYDRGEPESFPLNRVIKGWTEALQLMKVGDKWELYVPSELAYGEKGMLPAIPPNAVLIFDVELLDVGKNGGAGGGVQQ
jgi:FKBP-type peptidyl-prolyl cis-trans isomerase FklB